MLKRKALMESISSNLHNFLKEISNNLSVPDKKFLRDALVGLLRCGKTIVCQMAWQLPNQRIHFLSRPDRLESHLVKDSDFDNQIKDVSPQPHFPSRVENSPCLRKRMHSRKAPRINN